VDAIGGRSGGHFLRIGYFREAMWIVSEQRAVMLERWNEIHG
jgi:hypothetical protein